MYEGLGYELHRLVWIIDFKANALLHPYGLTYTQYRILRVINREAPVTGKELAGFMLVTPSSMSKSITKLISNGFVQNTQRPGVGNIQRLELTESGKRILGPVTEAMDTVLAHMCRDAGVDPTEMATGLHKMYNTIEHF